MSTTVRGALVWVALLVLASASWALAGVVHGHAALACGLGIAAAKGALVAWFYMHLSEEGLSIRITFVAALAFLVILGGLTLADVTTLATPELPAVVQP